MKPVLLITAVLSLILSFSACAKSQANKEIDALTLPIMEAIHNGQTQNIFSMAFPKGSGSRRYFSDVDIEQYDRTFLNSFRALGQSSGYFEYLSSDIPDVFVIKYYVVKFEVEPALIKFALYKRKDKWRINAIEIDDTLDDYLEAAAQIRLGTLGMPDIRKKIADDSGEN